MFARGMVREGGIFDRTVAPGDLIAMGDSDSTLTTEVQELGLLLQLQQVQFFVLVLREVIQILQILDKILLPLLQVDLTIILCNLIQQNHGQPLRIWIISLVLSFRFLFINLVAQAMTFAAGAQELPQVQVDQEYSMLLHRW